MRMKKLWAVVLTGLLGCTGVSWAADPANTVLPPVVQTPQTKLPDAPVPVADGGACAASQTKCPPLPYRPIIQWRPNFGAWWGCLTGDGKLQAWLTYRPLQPTPLGECGMDPREPPVYAYFLDVPCKETWKPVGCDCNKPKPPPPCAAGACSSCAPTPHFLSLPSLPRLSNLFGGDH
jgi:hypothetical protein